MTNCFYVTLEFFWNYNSEKRKPSERELKTDKSTWVVFTRSLLCWKQTADIYSQQNEKPQFGQWRRKKYCVLHIHILGQKVNKSKLSFVLFFISSDIVELIFFSSLRIYMLMENRSTKKVHILFRIQNKCIFLAIYK